MFPMPMMPMRTLSMRRVYETTLKVQTANSRGKNKTGSRERLPGPGNKIQPNPTLIKRHRGALAKFIEVHFTLGKCVDVGFLCPDGERRPGANRRFAGAWFGFAGGCFTERPRFCPTASATPTTRAAEGLRREEPLNRPGRCVSTRHH